MPDPVLQIVDAEAGGDISRVIIGGAPTLRGATVAEQCADFAARFDHLRWKLIQPPHGDLHMCPVLLLESCGDDADFGVIIMESMGYPPISGSNLFCAVAVALETGIAAMREPETRLRVATPGGIVSVCAQCRDGRCHTVEFENVPAWVKTAISLPGHPSAAQSTVTVVSAGVDYAAVDADQLGLALVPGCQERLREHGSKIAAHAGTDFVLFHESFDARMGSAGCRVAVFQAPSVICRSPTGTGTSALLTLAYAREAIEVGSVLATRSPTGGRFYGRIIAVQSGTDVERVKTAISGNVNTGREISIE